MVDRSHYAHPSGVEAIEICEHCNFCVGNAVKYLWRSGLKGSAVEDLKKAAWYLRRAHAGLDAYDCPSTELVDKVAAAEPDESLLRRVLYLLFRNEAVNYYGRVYQALLEVEAEIKEREQL